LPVYIFECRLALKKSPSYIAISEPSIALQIPISGDRVTVGDTVGVVVGVVVGGVGGVDGSVGVGVVV